MTDDILTAEKLAEIEARVRAPRKDFSFAVGRDEKTLHEASELQLMINQLIGDRYNLLESHKLLQEERDGYRKWLENITFCEDDDGQIVRHLEVVWDGDDSYLEPADDVFNSLMESHKAQAAEIERLTKKQTLGGFPPSAFYCHPGCPNLIGEEARAIAAEAKVAELAEALELCRHYYLSEGNELRDGEKGILAEVDAALGAKP